MTGAELASVCEQIHMTVEEFGWHAGKSPRTVRRWLETPDKAIPGPVAAMALAWLQCHRHGVDYGPIAFIGNARHDSHDWLIV